MACHFRDPWVPLAVFEKFNKIKELLAELGDDDVEKHILKSLEVTFFSGISVELVL